MNILCLWSPAWSTGEAPSAERTALILEEAPRVVVEGRGVVWVDVKGLPAADVARRLVQRMREQGEEEVRAGVGSVPIVAEGAARFGKEVVEVVGLGEEGSYLASLPLIFLTEDPRLLGLLEGTGVTRCGDLAGLDAEAVEVRFGREGRRVWRLSRGEDPRLLFRPIPPERPHASLEFVDYTVQDATRLVFTLNALLDQVCDGLRARARRARSLTLTFTLANGERAREVLRTARPTADRSLWMRRLRAVLEDLRLPDAIAGVALEVESSEPISALQGDLFDRGFSTSSFVEEAVARLMDVYHGLFVRVRNDRHPLAERRTSWVDLTPEAVTAGERQGSGAEAAALTLQLLEEPQPIRVGVRRRRDHVVPLRYQDGREWHALTAAGPDRISGGHEEARPYAREYFRCASDGGALLWIYRDAVEDRWFLHGWWD